MLWNDSADVDCDMDSITYLSRVRSLLRIVGVVHLEIWVGGSHYFVDNWWIALDQCSHDIYQVINRQHDR